jgi:hypothetical protein
MSRFVIEVPLPGEGSVAQAARAARDEALGAVAVLGLNIRNFGAVGNNTADDSAAWAAMIAAALASGRPCELPAGGFYIPTAPGVVPDPDESQVDVPAIINPTKWIVIRGAGPGLTTIRARCDVRPGLNSTARISWPILRVIGGPGLILEGVTLDGGRDTVPSAEADGGLAPTLTSPGGDAAARACCTLIETDGTAEVILRDVKLTRFYGVRDNTDIGNAAFRSRRTGGICIHRAAKATVDGLELDTAAYREGPYFANCRDTSIRNFRFIGALPRLGGSHALSSPISIFGPETLNVTLDGFWLQNNQGSAANIGGAGSILVTNGHVLGSDVGGTFGDGLDFGAEHMEAYFTGHPNTRRLQVTGVTFVNCHRYALRARREAGHLTEQVIFSDLQFTDCYQGPEILNATHVTLNNISVLRPFARADYAPSGRAVVMEGVETLTWGNIQIDGRGRSGDVAMRIGLYLSNVQAVQGGTLTVHEATEGHVVLYQASNDNSVSGRVHLGDIQCHMDGARSEATIWSPIHIGRNGKPVSALSFGRLTYNDLPALEQPGVVTWFSDAMPLGAQRAVMGDPNNSGFGYQHPLAQIDIANGDPSGAPTSNTRGRIEAETGNSLGRGARFSFYTTRANEALARALTVTEHGSIIFHPVEARPAAVSREVGEHWTEGGNSWFCRASGSIFADQLVDVTAVADGTNIVTLSSAPDDQVLVSQYISVGGVTRRITARAGLVITLDGTITAGTGLTVLLVAPVLVNLTP